MSESSACKGCAKQLRRSSKTGYCASCFHANVDKVKTIYNADRWRLGHSKRSHWKHRGIRLTEEQIQRHEQTDQCDCCVIDVTKTKQLDHCHESGQYRGTLCKECNTGLGKLGDNLDLIIERVTSYRDKQKGLYCPSVILPLFFISPRRC